MNRRIYVHGADGQLQALEEARFAAEGDLQTLLESYPELLAGDQFDGQQPRRWMLISREASVPDRDDGAGRWSLDHLFLDQDGIPTLVEVKRSTDTRIRREVVGQMLDYAANGVTYWPVESLRSEFEAAYDDHLDRVARLLCGEAGPDIGIDVDDFWQTVKTNLQAGRIRMLFVADSIPRELARIVEFLNEQMDPAEVLAVAVRRYAGGELQTLVPQVIGQTAQSEARKAAGGRQKRHWDEGQFLEELRSHAGSSAESFARRVLKWAQKSGRTIRWGEGLTYGCFIPSSPEHNADLIALWSNGHFEFRFNQLRRHPPFDRPEVRQELVRRTLQIPAVSFAAEDAHRRSPNVPMTDLDNEASWTGLLELLDWVDSQIESPTKIR